MAKPPMVGGFRVNAWSSHILVLQAYGEVAVRRPSTIPA